MSWLEVPYVLFLKSCLVSNLIVQYLVLDQLLLFRITRWQPLPLSIASTTYNSAWRLVIVWFLIYLLIDIVLLLTRLVLLLLLLSLLNSSLTMLTHWNVLLIWTLVEAWIVQIVSTVQGHFNWLSYQIYRCFTVKVTSVFKGNLVSVLSTALQNLLGAG